MAIDERRRSELFEGLAAAIGPEAAVTMFDLLPPQDAELATRADVDHLAERMDLRFAQVDQRFAALEDRIDDRLDGLRTDLLAAFRGELVAAVSGQTRALIIATATATFGIGGLAVTLAQLL